MENKTQEEKPKYKPIIEAADHLSLGISIVVAIAIGVGIGLGLQNMTHKEWTLWIGVAIGIAAAILNVYKAYSAQYREYEELAKKRADRMKPLSDEEDDFEDYSGTKI